MMMLSMDHMNNEGGATGLLPVPNHQNGGHIMHQQQQQPQSHQNQINLVHHPQQQPQPHHQITNGNTMHQVNNQHPGNNINHQQQGGYVVQMQSNGVHYDGANDVRRSSKPSVCMEYAKLISNYFPIGVDLFAPPPPPIEAPSKPKKKRRHFARKRRPVAKTMPITLDFPEDGSAASSNGSPSPNMVSQTNAQNQTSPPSAKIVISGIPLHAHFDDIEPLLKPYGTVVHCDAVSSKDPNTQTIHITFDTHDQAQRGAAGLNGVDFRGNRLQVETLDKRRNNRSRVPYAGMPGPGRQTDFPLRLLVQSDMVGAIIGRQGSTIRHITQQSRARVDVHRKDNVGSLEKAITIYGNPENCTNACRRILEVMQTEATNTNKSCEIILKVLAHNNLIGRIIGKLGNTIKRIMLETDTKITVSSINDITSFNCERIITVKGSLSNLSKAESQISSKLRQSYENDIQAMAPQSIMFPGLHPMAMMSTAANGMTSYTGQRPANAPATYPPTYPMYQPPVGLPPGATEQQETTFLYIPNNAVGAIIGTKGSHIRNVIRFSGATVKISPVDNERPAEQQADRKVTIVGSPEAQWKAQYLIFEKMREEGFVTGTDDVRLTVEILVASTQVGRIIGKGGQNVRELQRVTGSIIKLPEHGAAPTVDEETTVHIIGAFFSVQSAQRRIRAMMLSTNPPPVTKKNSQKTSSNKELSAGEGPVAGPSAGPQ